MTPEQVARAVDAALLAREDLIERGIDWFTAAIMSGVALGIMLAGGPR